MRSLSGGLGLGSVFMVQFLFALLRGLVFAYNRYQIHPTVGSCPRGRGIPPQPICHLESLFQTPSPLVFLPQIRDPLYPYTLPHASYINLLIGYSIYPFLAKRITSPGRVLTANFFFRVKICASTAFTVTFLLAAMSLALISEAIIRVNSTSSSVGICAVVTVIALFLPIVKRK